MGPWVTLAGPPLATVRRRPLRAKFIERPQIPVL
jgi:hypothetical protein